MPTKTLADLDSALEKDPEYRTALGKLSRREAIARKLIRFRLEGWRRIRRRRHWNRKSRSESR